MYKRQLFPLSQHHACAPSAQLRVQLLDQGGVGGAGRSDGRALDGLDGVVLGVDHAEDLRHEALGQAVGLVAVGLVFDNLGDALRGGRLDHLLWLLAIEFILAILSDLLGRMVSYTDSLLSELFTNATSIRLMEHAATLELEDFEDPDLQDKLDLSLIHI